MQISINGPDVFSKESDDIIRRAVKVWMKAKKRKKVAYKRSKGAVAPQAGQNDEAKQITQADAGTQTEEELVQLEEREQEEVVAKVFCLDEDHDESDSEADDSGWEDDDDNQDYFSD